MSDPTRDPGSVAPGGDGAGRGPQAASAGPTAAQGDASHAARGAVLQFLAIVGQGLLPVYQMLVANLFGQAIFGAYRASVAILEVLVRGGMVGAAGGQYRFVAAHRAAGEDDLALRALGTGATIATVVSTVLALGLAILAPWLARAWNEPGLRTALPIVAASIPLAALTLVLMAATLAAKVGRMNLYVRGIAEPLLLFGSATLAWALGGGLRGLAIAHVGAALVTAVIALVACRQVFGGRGFWRAVTGPRHPMFLRFAAPLGVADVMNAILQRIDVFVVTSFAGLEALAVYSAAEYVARVIANPRYIFDPIIAPVIAESLQTRDRQRAHYNLALTTRWVIALAAPIAVTLIVLRVEVLGLYGPGFSAGAPALIILAGAHLVNGCLGLTPYVIAMSGRSRLFFLDNLGAALLNLGLGVFLVPRLGIIGAAIAAFASMAGVQLALTIQSWVLERIHPFAPAQLKPLAAGAVTAVAEWFVHATLAPGPARVVVVIAAGLIVYFTVLLALGLPAEERQFIGRVWGRLRGRSR